MNLLRNAIVSFSQTAIFSTGVSVVERTLRRGPGTFHVLMYHRIGDPRESGSLYPGMISTTPGAFRQQMELLVSRYAPVSALDVVRALRCEAPLPPRAVLVTFDDAYRDFAEFAWPVLNELKIPVTLFVATAFAEDPTQHFWWDRLYRAIVKSPEGCEISLPSGPTVLRDATMRNDLFRKLKEQVKRMPHDEAVRLITTIAEQTGAPDPADNGVLRWHELQQLQAAGVTLAPHTHTHPMLNRMSDKDVHFEVQSSWKSLQQHTVAELPRIFAYPAGGYDRRVQTILADHGFEAAFTTERGANFAETTDPLGVRRMNVGQRTTLGILQAQLALPAGRGTRRKPEPVTSG